MPDARAPLRVQLRRTKGYRKPAGAIVVSRPSKYGNRFRVGAPHPDHGRPMTRAEAVEQFRTHAGVFGMHEIDQADLDALRGHDVACWCALDEPCHGDVLLEWANA